MPIRINPARVETRERRTESGETITEHCVCVEVYNSEDHPINVCVDFITRLQDTATPPGPNVNRRLCDTMDQEVPQRREVRRGNSSVTMDGYAKICCCPISIAELAEVKNWNGAILVHVTDKETGRLHSDTIEATEIRIVPRTRSRRVVRSEKVKFGAWMGTATEEKELALGGALGLPKGWDIVLDASTSETLPTRITGTISVGPKAAPGDHATLVLELLAPQKHVPDQIRECYYLEFEVAAGGRSSTKVQAKKPKRKSSR
jgi:hypothetical protein